MEPWNRLKVTRSEGKKDNGGKKGKELDKTHV